MLQHWPFMGSKRLNEICVGLICCNWGILASKVFSVGDPTDWFLFRIICPIPIIGNRPLLFTQLGLPRGLEVLFSWVGDTASSLKELVFSSYVKDSWVGWTGLLVGLGEVPPGWKSGDNVLSLELLRPKFTGELRIRYWWVGDSWSIWSSLSPVSKECTMFRIKGESKFWLPGLEGSCWGESWRFESLGVLGIGCWISKYSKE